MTREEAITNLEMIRVAFVEPVTKEQRELIDDTFDMAIKALEQEPILDKIRAEIIEEKDFAYADFEQYKVDYLGVDAEYVEDELPQDDFRYGMERCIDILNKYKAEREE